MQSGATIFIFEQWAWLSRAELSMHPTIIWQAHVITVIKANCKINAPKITFVSSLIFKFVFSFNFIFSFVFVFWCSCAMADTVIKNLRCTRTSPKFQIKFARRSQRFTQIIFLSFYNICSTRNDRASRPLPFHFFSPLFIILSQTEIVSYGWKEERKDEMGTIPSPWKIC